LAFRATLSAVDVPDELRARANEPPPPALEQVRSFLRSSIADADGLAEVRADLVSLAKINPETVRRRAAAIEAVLADRLPPGTLATLVAVDGNWVLGDETSDAAAAAWLNDLAVLVRGVAVATRKRTRGPGRRSRPGTE
jgi:hypothetical protein